MEALFFLVCSGFFGYIYQKLEKLETKLDRMEDDVLILKQTAPKRREDHVDFTLKE
jgi:hypothetical protein